MKEKRKEGVCACFFYVSAILSHVFHFLSFFFLFLLIFLLLLFFGDSLECGSVGEEEKNKIAPKEKMIFE